MENSNRRRTKKAIGKRLEQVLVSAIECLISQGHSFDSIKKYSIPQLFLFVSLISERYESIEDTDGKNKRHKVKTSYRDR